MTADTIGGVWTYALELAQGLGRRGHSVALATMGEPLSPAQRWAARQIPGLTVYESRYRLEWMDDPWADVAEAGQWLLELAARVRPDVVHLNGYCHAGLAWPAPVLVVAHSCVLSWWLAVKGEEVPVGWQRYAETVRRGLRAADLVAAPTRAMLDSLETCYGRLPAAVFIPNGRSPRPPASGPKQPVIFSAGRLWDEAKNIELLEQAAPGLAWPVVVVGDRTRPGEAPRDRAEAEAGPLQWLGVLPPAEMSGWLARASIYALPARYEPFGLSVLEAALAGCALVLGDIPSLPENWQGEAIFVSPDNAQGLHEALEDLIADEGLRERLGRAAHRRGLTFSPDRMTAAYLAVYAELRHRHLAGRAARTTQTPTAARRRDRDEQQVAASLSLATRLALAPARHTERAALVRPGGGRSRS